MGPGDSGRFAEAQEHLRIAEELDPLGAGPLQNRAGAYYMAHNYPEARRVLRRWLELDPKAIYGLLLLASVDLFDNQCAAAQSGLQKLAGLYPELPLTKGILVLAAARCGRPEEALQFLARTERDGAPGIRRTYIACLYAAVHDADHVVEWLRKAADDHEAELLWLKFDPDFAEFRRDPRLIAVERRVGLPQ